MQPAEHPTNVVPIRKSDTHTQGDTVRTLRALLAHARAGRISGLVVAWRCIDGKYASMATGVYAEDHIAALGAASKLWSTINDAAE